MSLGYSRTAMRRAKSPAAPAREPNVTEFDVEMAYSHLHKARLHIMRAERRNPGRTEDAVMHALIAMDILKPGAIARLMPLAEDER